MPLFSALWFACVPQVPAAPVSPGQLSLTAQGHDSRIDLRWQSSSPETIDHFEVWRSEPFHSEPVRLAAVPAELTVYSDFVATNQRRFSYHLRAVCARSITTSAVVSAVSQSMTDEQLLSSVQEATARYFWDYAHPVSGLARERLGSGETVTVGGAGFGIMALVVAADRRFIRREAVAGRIVRLLRFLEDEATTYHGAWSHWLNGRTGATIPFSPFDDGGDLVETSFLIQGILTARQYFRRDNAIERELRERATRLWQGVEWDWYLREPGGQQLYWHWSPQHGWKMNHAIGGHFNECLIVYLLAMASPTHPISSSCYEKGWVGQSARHYTNGASYYGIQLQVGWPYGGPLFFTHYSFLGLDPRPWRDRYCNYFENNRAIARIHHAHARANPGDHRGYSAHCWGLTASDGPTGYAARDPQHDDGTIAPTAALASMPYTPRESMAALRHYYHALGPRLWGPFGFKDAFNLDQDWFADSYLAIDQGPTVVMIENHRSGLCWRLFMKNAEIDRALKLIAPAGR